MSSSPPPPVAPAAPLATDSAADPAAQSPPPEAFTDPSPVDDVDCPWRAIGPWELDDFFRQIRTAVLELEDAYSQGRLTEALEPSSLIPQVGREIYTTYRLLETAPPRKLAHLRLDAVRSMLSLLREEIFELEHHADARLEDPEANLSRCTAVAFTEPRIFARLAAFPEERLRLDQVLSARFWGLGFSFEDPSTATNLAHLVAHACLNELSRGLRELDQVLGRFQPQDPDPQLHIVPSPAQRRFERLMLDILNEVQRCARVAPLEEDFLEKTDLRVQYPELNRKRGARVQVTQIDDEARHREKTSRIWRQGELVVLSPLTLAKFILEEATGILPEDLLKAFWSSLPDRPHPIPALAATLKRSLLRALSSPLQSPLGPLVHVPPSLRAIIRAFVRHQAFASTHVLRTREQSIKGHASKPGRSSSRSSARPPVPKHLRAGTTVEGTVKNVVGYGVFIDVGGADGLLHISAINPARSFTRGEQVLVRIEEIEGNRIRLALPR